MIVDLLCGRRRMMVAGLPVGLALCIGVLLIVALWPGAGFAEKLVDPNNVAPEFRGCRTAARGTDEAVRMHQKGR
jgi:hypothetical protein